MFIEVVNYETGQTEPINLYDIAYFYKKENDDSSNPYVVVYKMVSGITYLEGFASSSDADAKLEDLSEAVAGGGLSQFDTYGDFPDEGNKSMVYIAKDTGQTYYWDENTSTYITTGTAGRTGVYAASVDLNSTIGASTTVNKTDLTVLVTPTVAYSEGSEVVGANSTHGLITAIASSSVTVKTIPDNTIDSFVQVANEAALPQTGQENILYYLQDTATFRIWDATNQDYVEPASGGENLNLILNMSRDTDNDYGRQTKPLDFGALPVGRTIVHNYQAMSKPAPTLPAKFYYTYKYTNPYTETEVTVNKYFTIPDDAVPLTFIIDKRIDFQELANNFYNESGHTGVNYNFRGFFTFTMISKDSQTDYDIMNEALMTGSSSSLASSLFSFYTYYKFKSTFYQSKSAASGGTNLTLVSTGDKYTWNNKQDALVSGTNIKTINNESILGSGDLTIGSSAPTFVYSTSSSTDKGTGISKRLDFDDLDVGTYVYYNYSAAYTFYYQYTKPNASSKTTSSIINSTGSNSQIGTTNAYYYTITIDMYHKTSELGTLDYSKKEPLCKVTLSYGKPGQSTQQVTANNAQEISYLLYKNSSDGTLSYTSTYTHTDTRCIDSKLSTISSTASSASSTASSASSTANNAYNLASSASSSVSSLNTTVSSLETRVTNLEKGGGDEPEEVEELIASGEIFTSTSQMSGTFTPETGSSGANFSWTVGGYTYDGYISSLELSYLDSSAPPISGPIKVRIDFVDDHTYETQYSKTAIISEPNQTEYISFNQGEVPAYRWDVRVYRLTGGEIYSTYGMGYQSNFDGSIHNHDNTGALQIYCNYSQGGMMSKNMELSGYSGTDPSTMQPAYHLMLNQSSYPENMSNAVLRVYKQGSMYDPSNPWGTHVMDIPLGDITSSTYNYDWYLEDGIFSSLSGENVNFVLVYNYQTPTVVSSEVNLSDILLPYGGSIQTNLPVYQIDYSVLATALSATNGTIKNDIGDCLILKGQINGPTSGPAMYRYTYIDVNDYMVITKEDSFTFESTPYGYGYSSSTNVIERSGRTINVLFNKHYLASNVYVYERLIFYNINMEMPEQDIDWTAEYTYYEPYWYHS